LVVGEFILRVYLLDHAPAHVHVIHATDEIRISLIDFALSRVRGRMTAGIERRAIAAVRDNHVELLAMWEGPRKTVAVS
jgi:hypothetical protein